MMNRREFLQTMALGAFSLGVLEPLVGWRKIFAEGSEQLRENPLFQIHFNDHAYFIEDFQIELYRDENGFLHYVDRWNGNSNQGTLLVPAKPEIMAFLESYQYSFARDEKIVDNIYKSFVIIRHIILSNYCLGTQSYGDIFTFGTGNDLYTRMVSLFEVIKNNSDATDVDIILLAKLVNPNSDQAGQPTEVEIIVSGIKANEKFDLSPEVDLGPGMQSGTHEIFRGFFRQFMDSLELADFESYGEYVYSYAGDTAVDFSTAYAEAKQTKTFDYQMPFYRNLRNNAGPVVLDNLLELTTGMDEFESIMLTRKQLEDREILQSDEQKAIRLMYLFLFFRNGDSVISAELDVDKYESKNELSKVIGVFISGYKQFSSKFESAIGTEPGNFKVLARAILKIVYESVLEYVKEENPDSANMENRWEFGEGSKDTVEITDRIWARLGPKSPVDAEELRVITDFYGTFNISGLKAVNVDLYEGGGSMSMDTMRVGTELDTPGSGSAVAIQRVFTHENQHRFDEERLADRLMNGDNSFNGVILRNIIMNTAFELASQAGGYSVSKSLEDGVKGYDYQLVLSVIEEIGKQLSDKIGADSYDTESIIRFAIEARQSTIRQQDFKAHYQGRVIELTPEICELIMKLNAAYVGEIRHRYLGSTTMSFTTNLLEGQTLNPLLHKFEMDRMVLPTELHQLDRETLKEKFTLREQLRLGAHYAYYLQMCQRVDLINDSDIAKMTSLIKENKGVVDLILILKDLTERIIFNREETHEDVVHFDELSMVGLGLALTLMYDKGSGENGKALQEHMKDTKSQLTILYEIMKLEDLYDKKQINVDQWYNYFRTLALILRKNTRGNSPLELVERMFHGLTSFVHNFVRENPDEKRDLRIFINLGQYTEDPEEVYEKYKSTILKFKEELEYTLVRT